MTGLDRNLMQAGASSTSTALERTLLDYQGAPGRYSFALKQPALLYASTREILQLACGRSPDGAALPSQAVQRAACFFIRSALLEPGRDHYALLGIGRTADAAAIKDRYRQLMRVMHPDFARAGTEMAWPADAAARINRAYEVLASPEQRREYDEKLQAGPIVPPRAVTRPAELRAAAARAPAQDPRRWLKRLAGGFGAAAAVILLMKFAGAPELDSLVQRPGTSVAAATAARTVPQPVNDAPSVVAAAAALAMPEPPLLQSALPAADPVEAPPPVSTVAANAAVAPPVTAPLFRFSPPAASGRSPASALPTMPTAPAVAAATPPDTVTQAAQARSAEPPTADLARATPANLRLATFASGASGASGPPAAPSAAPSPSVSPTMPSASPAAASPVLAQLQPSAVPPAAPAPQAAPQGRALNIVDVHPLLSKLLQQMERGPGERLISDLDREGRNSPTAQALARQYDNAVGMARSVKVADVQFQAEPREGRLLVNGHVSLLVSDRSDGMASRELSLQAEFARRDGTIVMTRLGTGRKAD